MNTTLTIILGIIGLGFLVLIHETGHFIAARLCGVKVESFSIGMGPVLLHKKFGNTDYRISLLPFGGYCGMKGESDFRKAIEEEKPVIEGDNDSFYGVKPYKRIIIAFAGPFINLVFGYIAFVIIALIGYTYYSAGTVVQMSDEIYENTYSAAHAAGMQTGDEIIAINGKPMNDFSELANFIILRPDEDLTITFKRNEETKEIVVHTVLDKETGRGLLGIVSDPDSRLEREYPSHSFFPALIEGAKQTHNLLISTLKSLRLLFKGIDLTNAVSGPIKISSMLGETVQQSFSTSFKIGIINTLEFLSLISLSLFITNLLPIPALDGGLILVAFIETVTRKRTSPKLLQNIQFIGLAFIGFLLIIAIMGDIKYFFIK